MEIGNKVHYRIGTWNREENPHSSNWREFENLVSSVEDTGKQKLLQQSIVALATDNEVVEAALHKGNFSDEKLFDLVLRLRCAEMKYSTKLLVSHVAGKRMMAQGLDGVSRGKLRSGLSIGEDMLSYFPWGKSALEVNKGLLSWIKMGP